MVAAKLISSSAKTAPIASAKLATGKNAVVSPFTSAFASKKHIANAASLVAKAKNSRTTSASASPIRQASFSTRINPYATVDTLLNSLSPDTIFNFAVLWLLLSVQASSLLTVVSSSICLWPMIRSKLLSTLATRLLSAMTVMLAMLSFSVSGMLRYIIGQINKDLFEVERNQRA